MNDFDVLEQRYVQLAVEGVGLFGDDPAEIRRHIDRALSGWSEADRRRLRELLAIKTSAPAQMGPGESLC
ncbi:MULTISPECIES: hypothetical protein [unclassified Aureimonas]|uniref:hypothetical protein n=1 Tax=unclassified Aureimonas TaxID=2615206 RepID=UPI0011DF5EEE|nr:MULTISPECIES: hypothetical protein [unclassified Aureimonas]